MLVDEDLAAELQRVWGTGSSSLGGGVASADSKAETRIAPEDRDPRGESARAGVGGQLVRLRIGPDGRVRLGPGYVMDDRYSYIHDPEAVAWIGFSF